MTRKTFLLASQNPKKIAEINAIVKEMGITVEPISDTDFPEEIPETGSTLEENALQKATFVFKKTGKTAIADDTGLLVQALDNAPGVYSARYAGPEKNSEKNIDLLLKNLTGIENRKAKFATVIALVSEKEQLIFMGEIEGEILMERSGKGGFGYDAVFKPLGYNLSFAEMEATLKNKISHRANALEKLKTYLAE
ncbi:MAG: RdgB/HAM1 family non-canonical purine NTP pyrophosphatase [Luteibaculaceae bacterium]